MGKLSPISQGWHCTCKEFIVQDASRNSAHLAELNRSAYEDWHSCRSTQLEKYCAEATPARRVTAEMHVPDMRT